MSDTVHLIEVKRKLLRRGTLVNDGFAGDVSKAVAEATGLRATPLVCEMFKTFDGFPEGVVDGASGIRIWPLRDVLLAAKESSSSPRLAFADFLMDSDDLLVDITNEDEPIVYETTGQDLAANLSSFLTQLSDGMLDFL